MLSIVKAGGKAYKILAILILSYIYFFIFGLFRFIGGVSFMQIIVLLLIFGSMGFTIYAYISEKQRLFLRNEVFKKDNLFFRYGNEVLFKTLPIPVKENWTPEKSGSFGYMIINRIQNQFINSYGSNPLNGTQVVTIIGATDLERPSDSRGFLKISFSGVRGAVFSRFITFQVLGKNIVIHLIAYLLGMPKLLDVIYFVVCSPFTIYSWIFRWFRNEYSIYSTLAKEIDNSFEIIDMLAYYESTKDVIADCIIEELVQNGLFNENLGNAVNYTFVNSNVNFGNASYDQSTNNSGNTFGNNSGNNFGNNSRNTMGDNSGNNFGTIDNQVNQ